MKRKLLIVCCLLAFAISFDLKAQDFDLDFYRYFQDNAASFGSKTTAKDAFNWWKAQGAAGTRVIQNGISFYVATTSRANQIGTTNEPSDLEPKALRARFDNDLCDMVIESPNDLRTVALQYRGNADGNAGAFQISFGEAADKPLTSFVFEDVIATSPGQARFYNFPANIFTGKTGVKYVKITRKTGIQSALYRVAASTTTFTTLPVKFVSFTAETDLIRNAVKLNWATTNEVNTKDFVIERGTESLGFKPIGIVASVNSEGIHNYSFTDESAIAGLVYYRIKQVDNDGQSGYSKVVKVVVKGSGISLSAYPNPTTDILTVSHQSVTNASLKVLNAQGQSVLNLSAANGSTATKLNVASLASGIYYVVLNNDGAQSSVKFVKN